MLCLVLCSFKDTRIRLCISILNSCDHHFERVSAAMRFPSPGCRCPSAWFRNTAGLSCDRFGSGFSNGFPKSATVNLSMFYPFGSGFSNGFPMVFQWFSNALLALFSRTPEPRLVSRWCHARKMPWAPVWKMNRKIRRRMRTARGTLWLCQNSYWKWPIYRWFTY